jgi:glycosyltransferase involved in cell wall biosynthesis
MKTISVLVPTFNEEDNVRPLAEALKKIFSDELPDYRREIIFIDNYSTDKTRQAIEEMCAEDPDIKAIFNARNFGGLNSSYYGLLQTTGDAAIMMDADFQDPVEMIPKFVREWEKGYRVVAGVKAKVQGSSAMNFIRGIYYKLIRKFSRVEQIEHFTYFGLYDRSFIDLLKSIEEPTPFLRSLVTELGSNFKCLEYAQAERRSGKTKYNLPRLYNDAMISFTTYTKAGLRVATVIGFLMSFLSVLYGIFNIVLKLMYWDMYPIGIASITAGVFFLGSVQLFFIGLLGEYIMSINVRVMKRPLVIEERRINFTAESLINTP